MRANHLARLFSLCKQEDNADDSDEDDLFDEIDDDLKAELEAGDFESFYRKSPTRDGRER